MPSAIPDRLSLAAGGSLETLLAEYLDHLVLHCRSEFGAELRAVVLTGSLGRGHGVVYRAGQDLRLLSDVDLYMVCAARHGSQPAASEFLHSLKAEAPEWLSAPLDLAVVGRNYFATLGSTLPAFQTANSARVLWDSGAEFALPEAAALPTGVDPEDALVLLLNRMMERLVEAHRLRGRGSRGWSPEYHEWKLRGDAVLAFLAAYDLYDPDRPQQLAAISRLAQDCESADADFLRSGAQELTHFHEACARTALGDTDLSAPQTSLREWCRTFLRAGMIRTAGHGSRAGESLRDSVARRQEPLSDEEGKRWLGRRGPIGTARVARKWHGLAPRGLQPWWRYGWNGTGPERLYWSGVECFESRVPSAMLPLLDSQEQRRVSDAHEGEKRLASLWLEWILGERAE